MPVMSSSRIAATAQAAALCAAVLLGQVRDRTTGQPLTHVLVEVGGRHATTDGSGRFSLAGLALGKQTVTLSSSDVPPQRFQIVLTQPVTRFDVRACSATLDYSCGGGSSSPGNG